MTRRRWTPLGIALAIGLVLALARTTGCQPLDLLDLRALDYRFLQRGPLPPAPEVVVVAIDDESIRWTEKRWPWPRPLVARLIDHLSAAGPVAIGVDFVQSETSSNDQELVDAVGASQRTVLGYFFDFTRREGSSPYAQEAVYPISQAAPGAHGYPFVPHATATTQNLPELAAAAAGLGYFNFIQDADGLLRRAPLAIAFANRVALPLSLIMLQRYWPDRQAAIRFDRTGVDSLRLGPLRIPAEEDGRLLLNFRGPGRTIPHISAVELLADPVPPETAERLRDKLVLLGVSAIAVGDVLATPFDALYPGVELHATVIDNVLRNDFVYRPAWLGSARLGLADAIMVLTLVLLLGLLLGAVRGLVGALLAAALLGLYLAGSQLLFVRTGAVLSVAYPTLAVTLSYIAVSVHHYVTVEREKRATRRVLDLYLSPTLARYLSQRPEMLRLGGEKSERTVLFSDLRNSTSIAERLDPEQFVELLNVYLGAMTDVVFAHDGMLDKYIGDGVMAVWSAPLPQADHAARACRAALAMVDGLTAVNAQCARRGWPALAIRIGLNTGPMIFGNMGSAGHLSLTVIGDHVNLGARLEGLNKLYGTTIIASQSTTEAARGVVVTRELDLVRVKGKAETSRIFEVLGAADSAPQWHALIEHFHAGLAAYRAQQWVAALEAFAHALQIRPADGPSDLYFRRCRQHLREPPPSPWEPVTTFAET